MVKINLNEAVANISDITLINGFKIIYTAHPNVKLFNNSNCLFTHSLFKINLNRIIFIRMEDFLVLSILDLQLDVQRHKQLDKREVIAYVMLGETCVDCLVLGSPSATIQD